MTSSELVFSGSVVVDKDNTSGFGTKANPPLVAIYTSAYKNTAAPAFRRSRWPTAPTAGTTFTKYAGNPVLDIGSGELPGPEGLLVRPSQGMADGGCEGDRAQGQHLQLTPTSRSGRT